MKHLKANHAIPCRSLAGETVQVPLEKMRFRSSVYGFIPHAEKLLLVRTRTSGLFAFPGGGINLGEPILAALAREIREETGIQVAVDRFFYFVEDFFFFDPHDTGYHAHLFFYLCTPLTTELKADDRVKDFYSENPRWASIKDLDPGDFQPGIREALTFYLETLREN